MVAWEDSCSAVYSSVVFVCQGKSSFLGMFISERHLHSYWVIIDSHISFRFIFVQPKDCRLYPKYYRYKFPSAGVTLTRWSIWIYVESLFCGCSLSSSIHLRVVDVPCPVVTIHISKYTKLYTHSNTYTEECYQVDILVITLHKKTYTHSNTQWYQIKHTGFNIVQ